MNFHLAQVNVGRILAPLDSPVMAGFVDNLDKINMLAETSPGFIWRLKDDANNATSIRMYDDDRIIMNMSVWETPDHLYQYVYKSMHGEFLKRRREWFEKMGEMYYVMWYVPVGHLPVSARHGSGWCIYGRMARRHMHLALANGLSRGIYKKSCS